MQYVFQPAKKKPAAAGGGKAVKGKKKASTAYDSEEPTEQEMSVRNMCHECRFTYMIRYLWKKAFFANHA